MIKNIILDVGDVLIDYRWKDMLMDYGLSESEALRIGNIMFTDPLWRELDLANKTDMEVISMFAQKYPDDGAIIEWFITHGEYMFVPRKSVWEKVRVLKEQGYKIYILSNYSKNLFDKHTNGASFIEDADGMVVSYMIHIVKPDARIYRYLLEKYELNADECVFFDDRAENVKAAENMGIQSAQVTSEQQLLQLFQKLIRDKKIF